jgi:Berberine and berberine like
MNKADNDRCIAWARKTFAKMQPFFASARYVNYPGDDETGEPVAAANGPNYRRLQKLKSKYDPENFFRMNQNIRPLALNLIRPCQSSTDMRAESKGRSGDNPISPTGLHCTVR